jgi:hypothetical protein
MPTTVAIGQKWSVWTSGRQQWLLATVISRKAGQATLKYDTRYGVRVGDDEQVADEPTMLTTSNLFRFIEQ